MLYNQPLAIRFGTELLRHIDKVDKIDPFWDSLDIAVAWVRASGMAYLSDRFANFLRHGGNLSVIVGIDLQNTTREGLQALLDLEQHGHCETFVYHNEAGSIFHPKLYLFRNEEEARLIVGSNNITEGGLYVNVEATLQVDSKRDASIVAQTLDAISSWKDIGSRLAVRLDSAFLDRLSKEGYVPDEATVRARLRREGTRRRPPGHAPLFASRPVSPPRNVRGVRSAARKRLATKATSPGTVVLMRLRTSRGTQAQIPFRVVKAFFGKEVPVRSSHSGQTHRINRASAKGKPNTMKLEMPETRNFTQPVARFEKTPSGFTYETYDVGTPQGNQILASLLEGRRDGTTQLSISNAEKATWWRFI